MSEGALREQMVRLATRMYERDYIAGVAGNLSARLTETTLLTTPGGGSKADLDPEGLVVVDLEGEVVRAPRGVRPTSELPMHLEVYRQRPDVGAALHAHPVHCVALSMVGISLDEPLIPEAVVLLGPVPTAAYATPSSEENRDAIADLIGRHDAILLAHHGSLTVGRDLEEAFLRLETLEHVARTVSIAHRLGRPSALAGRDLEKLLVMRREMGLHPVGREDFA